MGREGGTHEDFRWGEFFMVGSLTRVWGLPWDDCMRLWAFMREKGVRWNRIGETASSSATPTLPEIALLHCTFSLQSINIILQLPSTSFPIEQE